MATIKQKKAVKKIIENNGNVSQSMIEVGYSPETAKNPQQLTESKGFQELVEKYLPDDKLLKKHDEALEANKVISANVFPGGKDGKPVNDFIDVPDYQTRLKAVELGYKVKKHLVDKVEHSGEIRTIKTEEELDAIISKFRGEAEIRRGSNGKSNPKGK